MTLTNKRGSIKAKFTIFKSYLDEIDANGGVLDAMTIQNLLGRIYQHEQAWIEFDKVQFEIENEGDGSVDVETRTECSDIYFELLSRAKLLVNNDSGRPSHNPPSPSSSSRTSETVCNIKLPTIHLPTFDGSLDHWLEFRDSFLALVHNNKCIEAIQKYHYLKSSLSGTALNIISTLPVCNDSYATAWQLINERFNNKAILINNHIKAFFTINKVSKGSVCELRNVVDEAVKNLRMLKVLEINTDQWDLLLIYILVEKLDHESRAKWEEMRFSEPNLPTFNTFQAFILNRAQMLETLQKSTCTDSLKGTAKVSGSTKSFLTQSIKCKLCDADHKIKDCEQFKQLNPNERYAKIKALKLCINCFNFNHNSRQCFLPGCSKCKQKHNILLHFDKVKIEADVASGSKQTDNDETLAHCNSSSYNISTSESILLSTVSCYVLDSFNELIPCRILLDSGSQSNFVTRSFSQKLKLPLKQINVSIVGIGKQIAKSNASCNLTVKSSYSNFHANIECIVVEEICSKLPSIAFDRNILNIPASIKLADNNFNVSGKIDILLGVSIFWDVIDTNKIILGNKLPILIETKFGYIISGRVPTKKEDSTVICNFAIEDDLNKQLARFWEIEELIPANSLSKEEVLCEKHFIETHTRLADGRFCLKFPLKESVSVLGDSKMIAERRLASLQKRLNANLNLKSRYNDFLKEYLSMGHMKKIDPENKKFRCYIPHHGVLNENSLTTKLRVVFDASCHTSTGRSLNSIQLAGAAIQGDLFAIVIRSRIPNFIVCADVEKMFRQIVVDDDKICLCILWDFEDTGNPETFELLTVTYGTRSAPFQACRCMHQVADEFKTKYPEASTIIKNEMYVDDLLTGFNNIEKAIEICYQIDLILKSGKFNLRKWVSNQPEIIKPFLKSDQDIVNVLEETNNKTLGLYWTPKDDKLLFNIDLHPEVNLTKRKILSISSQVYDPLGLVGPAVIHIKLLLQRLWLLKIGWDEMVPNELALEFNKFCQDLMTLNSLRIGRQVICQEPNLVEIHGFCDASERAYAAAIFVRSRDANDTYISHLLCAKSRVAPLKVLSIPRLELCAALLLSNLVKTVVGSLTIGITSIHLWSDSTITLGWIQTPPHLLKTFVATRVSEIQTLTANMFWHHISTNDNPSDILSRGAIPSQFSDNTLWWHGPDFLMQENDFTNLHPKNFTSDLPEIKTTHLFKCNVDVELLLHRYSTLTRLKRVTAICLRFINNCRSTNKVYGYLKVEELNNAFLKLVKINQSYNFTTEIHCLENNNDIPRSSVLLKMNPFLDGQNILRVGGRLEHSDLPYNAKHPILLAKRDHFTDLIFEDQHLQLGHCGAQHLLYAIRQSFWPINGKSIAKRILHKCIRCYRAKPQFVTPLMGNLPKNRVTINFPFTFTGIDYGGPFLIKDKKGRGFKTTKAYVALFICFITKAVHLELVSDLTSDCFLAALWRYIARRGMPTEIHSDNGTTFIGADNELRNMYRFLHEHNEIITNDLSNRGIKWKFITPNSPHLGGLWEAGIKSMKQQLKKVIGLSKFTYEEYCTILIQIEAILNSRPLYPMSEDPSDLLPLTPSHFLLGRCATIPAEADLTTVGENRLDLYQKLQKIQQQYWKRWSTEYLCNLQSRTKYRAGRDLKLNDLVLIQNENANPLCWLLGRITKLHPGSDNIARIASVKTKNGIIQRAVTKLCPLPTTASNEQ